MGVFYDWVKPIFYFSVFITILMQIVPGSKYKKYIRFFAGLLMIVLLLHPVLHLLQKGDIAEEILEEVMIQEQYQGINLKLEDLEENTKEYYEKIIEESMGKEMRE